MAPLPRALVERVYENYCFRGVCVGLRIFSAQLGDQALLDRPGVDQLQAMVEPQGVALLQAAMNAMSAPAERRAATDADWLERSGAMYARGGTDAHFAALNAVDRNSPYLCPGIIVLVQTLNGVDSDAIKAVQAQYLADYAAT